MATNMPPHNLADEEAPWLQTWDENGDPIVDGTENACNKIAGP